jgi:hypothetical protein
MRLSSGLSVLTMVLMATAGSAVAQTTTCSGTLAPGSYAAVNVPAGATCAVNNGIVNVAGNVTVGKGATFFVAFPNAQLVVNGSLLSTDANSIEVTANILGSVSLTGTTGSAIVTGSFIGGSLSVANSAAVGIVLSRNNVSGALLLQNNQCFNEGNCNSVALNTIGGSLVCAGNSPSPVDIGGSNTTGGAKVGQCSGL